MSRIDEEKGSGALKLSDALVSRYLQQNPDFFIRNSRMVEQMQIPHPVRGSISLVEWQLSRQRHQIQKLEEEITLLMEQAVTNENLFSSLIELQTDLATAPNLHEMLNRLQRWARGLGLAGANVRLFSERWNIGAPSDFTHLGLTQTAFNAFRIPRLGDARHFLGCLTGPELLLLLPQAKQVGSVALSILGEKDDLGMIIFSSRDVQHYQPGMGTALLTQLAKVLPSLLERWIERT